MMNYSKWGNELYSGRRSYKIVKHAKIYLGIAVGFMILSVLLLGFRGLNPSIEFSGGTQFIVTGAADANEDTAYKVLGDNDLKENARVTSLGTDSVRIQTTTLETGDANKVRGELAEAYNVPTEDIQTNSVGASWGHDVTNKALQSIVIFVVLVAVIMTLYFRSWTMSAAALIALANDLLVTVGFFALTQVEVSPATVIGFLTILGYSLYDTVVVFDKVKEVTRGYKGQETYTYGELVNLGVNQTLVRSINTSIVALLPVASILFIGSIMLGAGTLTDISLALFVGMLVGALSSIFVASPALALMEGARKKVSGHDQQILALRSKKRSLDSDSNEDADMEIRVAAKVPGRHLGTKAQPKRKNRQK